MTHQLHLPGLESGPQKPGMPTPGTLADKLLMLLKAGAELDHPTFERLTGSWRLAAVVFELRVLGWRIDKTDRYHADTLGVARTIATYHLAKAAQ